MGARQRRPVRIGGLALIGLGVVPGLPKLPFIIVGSGMYLIGRGLATPPTRPCPSTPCRS